MSSERGALWSSVSLALGEGATVITPGRHAAQRLRRLYDEEQRRAGHARWSPPALRSWTGFLEEMWRDLLLGGHTGSMLLSSDQERLLWQRIVEGDAALETLASSSELAELAQSSWNRLCTFRASAMLDPRGPGLQTRESLDDGGVDAGAFARWVSAWRERCKRDDLVTLPELPERLAAAIESRAYRVKHTQLVLAGFDELSPAQQHLVATLRSVGTDVPALPPRTAASAAVIGRTLDEGEELRTCAAWCIARAQAGCRVAVVVPELDSVRAPLGRVLHLAVARERRDGMLFADGAQPFGFGGGDRLAGEPLVVTALDILRLAGGALPPNEASRLLQSRYFAADKATLFPSSVASERPPQADAARRRNTSEQERAARAECDAFGLRKTRKIEPQVTLRDLVELANDRRWSSALPEINRCLQRMRRYLSDHQRPLRSYERWVEWMRGLLRAAGWGTLPCGASQRERQTLETFADALDTLAALSFTGERVTQNVALDLLAAVIDRKTLPAEMNGALIEVITPDDAAGTEFDALWCLRAGETSWPSRATTSPLLSQALQRKLRMPGTDRAQEATATAQVFRRLQSTASEVVFSYAAHAGEVSQRVAGGLRSSGLVERTAAEVLRDVAAPTRGASVQETNTTGAVHAEDGNRLMLERIADTAPIAALPDNIVHGGAALLQAQAACGFRAFAEHRLVSSPLDGAELGMDARRTGEVVHLVLQQLWTELGGRAALSAAAPEARAALVQRAIDGAIASAVPGQASTWSAALLRVERRRLRRLVDEWLQVELARPDFLVQGHEVRIGDARVGPLRLSLRVDRVDQVDGSRVLIDYKTGAATKGDWKGDRPDAPQLPLYAVLSASEQELGAVTFARVRRGKDLGMNGLAGRGGLLPSGRNAGCEVDSNFACTVESWKATLESLAEAFAQGQAPVNPKSYPETCTYCKQRLLCRLDVRTLEEDDSAEYNTLSDGGDA